MPAVAASSERVPLGVYALLLLAAASSVGSAYRFPLVSSALSLIFRLLLALFFMSQFEPVTLFASSLRSSSSLILTLSSTDHLD